MFNYNAIHLREPKPNVQPCPCCNKSLIEDTAIMVCTGCGKEKEVKEGQFLPCNSFICDECTDDMAKDYSNAN